MGLPSRIPRRVGGSASSAPLPNITSATYDDTGINYDVAIGGLPFKLATDPNNPTIRRTADYRTQQVDQSTEPGEQSTVQWWIESQSTFHLGAGQKYMDSPAPGNEGVRKLRYGSSTGVDPWTIGEATLLNQTTRAYNTSVATMMTADSDGPLTQFLVAHATSLTRVTETVTSGVPVYTTVDLSVGTSGTPWLSLTTDGSFYYLATPVGIWRGPFTGAGTPAMATQIYTMPSGTVSCLLSWVKSRLIACVTTSTAASVYTLLSQPASPPAAFPTTANYVHPNPNWQWTCVTEGPSAIYVAGRAGNISTIDKFTLDTLGAMPTLSGAATAVSFPPSEIVLGMTGFVSTVIGVATTKGFRVGTFVAGSTGDITMGPLSLQNVTLTGAVAGSDRFFYCGGTHDDGTAGLFRVDTSQAIHIKQFSYVPDQIFGWATDLRAADSSEVPVAGSASVVHATVDGRLGFTVPGFGLYVEHPSKLVPSGLLTTSRMRYETLDPKLIRFVRVRGDAVDGATDSGTITVATSTTDAVGQQNGMLAVADGLDSGDLAANLPPTTVATVSFTLARSGSDVTVGPTLNNYQLKALPAQRRQRNIILPLSIFDNDEDNTGQYVGGDGTALSRLLALEAMEDAADIVTLQYIGAFSDQELAELVVIDKIEFQETVDPTPRQGWGGVGVVTLRTVT